jgi:hypothetical protein
MTELGQHIKTLDKSAVHWKALELLRSNELRLPDLRKEGVEFDVNSLSAESRAEFASVVSSKDTGQWGGFRLSQGLQSRDV